MARTLATVSLRKIIKISVNGDAKRAIESFASKTGMTEIAVASRVYQWFVAQDDVLRKGIVGILPETYEVDIAELALRRIATDTAAAGDKPAKVKK